MKKSLSSVRIKDADQGLVEAVCSTFDELDRDAPTVVYCAGGYRSSIAASTLRANGFTDVSDLIGGVVAWTAAGEELQAGV